MAFGETEQPLGGLERDRTYETVLEALADRLLQASLRDSPAVDYPCYSERSLRRRGDLVTWPFGAEAETIAPAQSQLQKALRLLTRSHLPLRKRLAFRLQARGRGQQEVAARLGVSRSMVQRWTGEVCRELRWALREEREAALPAADQIREAFREDMSRYAPGGERHCKPGQEGCRGTGLCVARWYLYLGD